MKIAVLGAGRVGSALGGAFARAGHSVCYGVRDPSDRKHEPLTGHASLGTVRGAVEASDVLVLATPWAATEGVLAEAGDLAGRPLLDATNPLGPGFVSTHAHHDSGGEQVARWAPTARVVKAFDTTGFENLADPRYGDARAAMFVAGDDPAAVAVATRLASDIGFDAVAVGGLGASRILEPVAKLWIRLSQTHGRNVALGLVTREGA